MEDPWAGEDTINENSSYTESSPKFDENNNDSRPILDLADNLTNTINIFGDSAASSMMDSIIGISDPLAYGAKNNWGDYNSSNILSNNANHSKTNTTDKTIERLRNLNLTSQSKFKSNSDSTNPLAVFGNNNISNIDTQANDDDNQNDVDDDNDDDLGINEDELFYPIDVRIWSDEEIQHFNPLSLKNSLDGISIKVREIPEKEGLVFKHINYLISHTLKFGNEYNIPTNDKSKNKTQQDNETKVIRRYSDFAWLVEVLWKKYPFRLIPELPPKKFACKYF
jgi:sorting nexin-8